MIIIIVSSVFASKTVIKASILFLYLVMTRTIVYSKNYTILIIAKENITIYRPENFHVSAEEYHNACVSVLEKLKVEITHNPVTFPLNNNSL